MPTPANSGFAMSGASAGPCGPGRSVGFSTEETSAGVEAPRRVPFDVRQGGRIVLHDAARGRDGNPPFAAIWLAPGAYELATAGGTPGVRVSFTVGEREGPTLRVPLR